MTLDVASKTIMRASKILVPVAIIAAIAGYGGYTLGIKRTEYLFSRDQIQNFLWANAMIDTGETKRLIAGSDVFVRGAYLYIRTQPSWIAWFSRDRERDPEERIKQVAGSLKASLDRSSPTPPTEAEVEDFVRTYMGTHSTLQFSEAVTDELLQQLKEKK